MIVVSSANTISAEELEQELQESLHNPTIERLMFIETKAKTNAKGEVKESMLFPCYVVAYTKEPELLFKCDLLQYANGQFMMVEVVIPAKELGVTKRIWDAPPQKMMRNMTPWLDTEVAQ